MPRARPASPPAVRGRGTPRARRGLPAGRGGPGGARRKLSTDQQIDLWAALQQPPPDGGLWTGPKVAAYARDRWGGGGCKQTGWGGWPSARSPAGSASAAWPSPPRCRPPATRGPPRPPTGGRGKDALAARLA